MFEAGEMLVLQTSFQGSAMMWAQTSRSPQWTLTDSLTNFKDCSLFNFWCAPKAAWDASHKATGDHHVDDVSKVGFKTQFAMGTRSLVSGARICPPQHES
jgi:hypothetical protein